MDSGKYIDFNEESPNVVWGFVEKDGEFNFEQYELSHAALGDSDSIYCSLPPSVTDGRSNEEIVEVADIIRDHINESYHDFLIHAFNCPTDRTFGVMSNREILADSVLVLSKKRYVAHVINDEGKWVDKLKILGLEIKKSDTPEYVKVILEDLVRMILNGKTNTELTQRIKHHKEEYKNQPLKDIARPMSVKGLKKYTDMLEMTGSEKGFPYNVRAALFYNSLCGPSDKKIVPGDKVGIVYIKHPRSKYIAFPVDINTLPSFVTELTVDYETQWEKAYKKIVSYMSAMGWDFQSKKQEKRKKLFGF